MKHFSHHLYLIGLLCSLSQWSAQAETPVFVVNGESLPHMSQICMPHDGNSTITVSYGAGTGSLQDIHWQAIGDLKIISDDTLPSATFESTDLGKGVVRLRYSSGPCTTWIDLHLYKEFNPHTYGLMIEGPDCLTPGETVVFSVRPVLTRNLNSYIGVDNYFWNLTDTGANKPPFVDHIVYAAGDGSSVTFVAGTVQTGDEVRVNFGECNTSPDKAITKTLGKVPPRPILDRETLCIPYGNAPAEAVVVVNTTEGIEYTCSCPPQYAYVTDVTADGKARFIFTADSISASEIKINATYKDEEACGSSEAIVSVRRMWGDDVDLRYTGKGDCCATVGQPEEFSLEGTVPLYSSVHWDLPAGWERQGTTSSGFKIHIYPTNTAKGVDTLRVWGDACEDGIRKVVSTVVYVKPASVAAIEGPACVSIGVPDTFRVTLNNDGSTPVAYRWTTSDGQNLTAYTGNYAVITPTANTTTISVQPVGLKCDAAVFTNTLHFNPIAPTNIIADHTCIHAGIPDTVTLTLEGIQPNQQYEWIVPNDLNYTYANAQKTQLIAYFDGEPNTFNIGAYCIGSEMCGNSDTASITLSIDTVLFKIAVSDNPQWGYLYMVSIAPNNPDSILSKIPITYYEWYVEETSQFLIAGETAMGTAVFVQNPNIVHARVIVTLENGCKQSAVAQVPPANQKNISRSPAKIINANSINLQASPNPTNASLHVSYTYSQDIPASILVYDAHGHLMNTYDSIRESLDIDTSSYADGIYFIVLSLAEETTTTTFIVKH